MHPPEGSRSPPVPVAKDAFARVLLGRRLPKQSSRRTHMISVLFKLIAVAVTGWPKAG
jgi:hypothetical protein